MLQQQQRAKSIGIDNLAKNLINAKYKLANPDGSSGSESTLSSPLKQAKNKLYLKVFFLVF